MALSVETIERVQRLTEVRHISSEDRLSQAEVDIRNLADAILKLTEAVQQMRKVQDESLVLMSRILVRLNVLKEE